MTLDIPFRSRSSASDFICKDGEISSLNPIPNTLNPTLPPSPDIDFALVRTRLPGWNLNPDQYPVKTLVASDPSMEYWTTLGAQLLSQFKSEAENRNLFVAPFYVMAAWKTYSGQFLSPSQPVLLTPNSSVPLVATDGDINSKELQFKIAAAVCSLYFKMRAPEVLRNWVDTIESLQIFVSDSIQNWNTFRAFLPYKHISTDNYCESLDLATGIIANNRVCTDTFTLAWKANQSPAKSPSTPGKGIRFYGFAAIPLSEVDIKDSWSDVCPDPDRILFNPIEESGGIPVTIEGEGKEISIITRPLKLSTAGELKRIIRAYLRGNFNPSNITFSMEGSRDMMHWWCISRNSGGAALAFPAAAFRFFRVVVAGKLEIGENLQGFSIIYR